MVASDRIVPARMQMIYILATILAVSSCGALSACVLGFRRHRCVKTILSTAAGTLSSEKTYTSNAGATAGQNFTKRVTRLRCGWSHRVRLDLVI